MLAVVVAALALCASIAVAQNCNTFGCDPTKGVWGYFQDSNNFDDPNSQLMYQSYIFPTGSSPIVSANSECKDSCLEANVGETVYISDVWSFDQTCTQGGTCNCYAQPACSNFVSIAQQNYVRQVGSLCLVNTMGDPHFTGADNSHFDFSGIPNRYFCMLSDAHLHVNIFLGGRYGEYEGNPHKALTWIRKIGVMWAHHTFVFEARAGADASYGNGYLSKIVVDGEEKRLSQAGDKVSLFEGAAEVSWVSARTVSGDDLIDVYELYIPQVVRLRMVLRPEVENLRTEDDGLVHFSLQLLEVNLSDNVHGILGQTYRKDHIGRLGRQKLVHSDLLNVDVIPGDNGEGYLDGSVENYLVPDLLSADCGYSRFARAAFVDTETAEAIETASMSVGAASGSAVSPRNVPVLSAVETSFNSMVSSA